MKAAQCHSSRKWNKLWPLFLKVFRTNRTRVADSGSDLAQLVPGHLNQLFRVFLKQMHGLFVLLRTWGAAVSRSVSSVQRRLQLGANDVKCLQQDGRHVKMLFWSVWWDAELQNGNKRVWNAYIMRRVYSCTSIYYIFIMFMGTCINLSNVYCIIIMDTNVYREHLTRKLEGN